MKKLALVFAISFCFFSCEKSQELPSPTVEFKIGYLSDTGNGLHVENYLNQDTILMSELDTALTVTVVEFGLDTLRLPRNILETMEFTVYINTSNDSEVFTSGKNVYSIGRGGGSNDYKYISSISNSFVLPIRTSNCKINNNTIDINPLNDYIRISYESNYSPFSKVKTIRLKQ
jgi:hypothetical protein